MGAQGSTTIDFGAFPGSSHTTVDVVAAGVISTSLVEAWIVPTATADHTADEHIVESVRVVGAYLSDGNLRIHGLNTNEVQPPPTPLVVRKDLSARSRSGEAVDAHPRPVAPMPYGQFTVGWVWN